MEAGRSGCQGGWVLVRWLFLAFGCPPSHGGLSWPFLGAFACRAGTLVYLSLLLRALITLLGSALWVSFKSNYLPKVSRPNTITLGVRASTPK